MGLKEYARKRRFANTPEPARGGAAGGKIFVVQLHHASHRHFDFRLELDGVLKSWAIPKGPSFDPAVKRLAMEVEDHPISYAGFEGDIPKGNYGAGHVDVFDSGTWEAVGSAREGLAKGDLKFILHGDILRGSWVLVRTRRQGSKNQWLLIKHRDEFAGERDADAFVDPATDRPISLIKRRATWKHSPKDAPESSPPAVGTAALAKPAALKGASKTTIESAAFPPELCRSLPEPPPGNEWLHEVKWDGYRIVASVVAGKVRLWSRNAIEWTAKVPELVQAVASLKLENAQLDGEMLVLNDGRDDFNALQGRLSAENKAPLVYMLFDLPHIAGVSLRDVPLLDRKRTLAALLEKRPNALLRYSEHQIGNGKAMFAQATAAGLEGVVSKRVDSPYRGARNGDWIKAKARPSDEFVVVGFTKPKGSRQGIGALLLARPDGKGWKYAGRVGTGLNDEQLRALRKQLAPTVVKNPVADITLLDRKDVALAIWVKPSIVVEVFFQGIGGQGLLRQPAFKAFRTDKTAASIAKEAAREASAPRVASAPRKSRSPVVKSGNGEADAVAITHPERVVFDEAGITKGDVANYYRAVAPWLLREVAGRPLSVVRCPGGSGKKCFFQKHVATGWGADIHGVAVKGDREPYLSIDNDAGLLQLVQMNVLEVHPWGARSKDIEHADRIVFDLDPHASVKWSRVVAAARELRRQLESIGLQSFLRTSGGKGFHVVVPLDPPAPWDRVKRFAQAVASAMAQLHPKEFVSVAGESNRRGKIFVDWLRNGRGATSVASYSLRARPSAGVAMPLAWEELGRVKQGDAYTIRNAVRKIRSRAADPWADIDSIKQALPDID